MWHSQLSLFPVIFPQPLQSKFILSLIFSVIIDPIDLIGPANEYIVKKLEELEKVTLNDTLTLFIAGGGGHAFGHLIGLIPQKPT